MTTGRINQVATSPVERLWLREAKSARRSLWVWIVDCVLASVSQLSCTTAPVQRLGQPGSNPGRGPARRTGSAVPALRDSISTQNSAELRYQARVTFFFEWMVETTIDPYNSKTRAQVIRGPDDWHSVLKAKKEKQTRRFANQAFARCHIEAAQMSSSN